MIVFAKSTVVVFCVKFAPELRSLLRVGEDAKFEGFPGGHWNRKIESPIYGKGRNTRSVGHKIDHFEVPTRIIISVVCDVVGIEKIVGSGICGIAIRL